MSLPRFSVIICNYNYARYVGEALQSVLDQSVDDIEVVVVDDGSTDDSRVVLDRFDDPRIVRINQPNGGQAAAFNTGFDAARGYCIAFLDSDDLWYPDKLRTVAACLEDPSVMAVQHALELVDGDSRQLGVTHPAGPHDDVEKDVLAWVLEEHSYPVSAPTSALVFRREALEPLFPLPDRWRYCADIPLRLAFLHGRVTNCSIALGGYRTHEANGWWNSDDIDRKRVESMRDAQAALEAFLAEHGAEPVPRAWLSDAAYAAARLRFGALARPYRLAQKIGRRLLRSGARAGLEASRARLAVH